MTAEIADLDEVAHSNMFVFAWVGTAGAPPGGHSDVLAGAAADALESIADHLQRAMHINVG
jgi:hypothetical protein